MLLIGRPQPHRVERTAWFAPYQPTLHAQVLVERTSPTRTDTLLEIRFLDLPPRRQVWPVPEQHRVLALDGRSLLAASVGHVLEAMETDSRQTPPWPKYPHSCGESCQDVGTQEASPQQSCKGRYRHTLSGRGCSDHR